MRVRSPIDGILTGRARTTGRYSGAMTISRRAGWFLLGFAVWNAYVWGTFVYNVYPDHHFDTFFIVHLLIGAFTVALGVGVGVIGWRSLRRR
jgi:hypothetical protein